MVRFSLRQLLFERCLTRCRRFGLSVQLILRVGYDMGYVSRYVGLGVQHIRWGLFERGRVLHVDPMNRSLCLNLDANRRCEFRAQIRFEFVTCDKSQGLTSPFDNNFAQSPLTTDALPRAA